MSRHPVCLICGAAGHEADLLPAALISPSIANEIRKAKHDLDPNGYVCRRDLNDFRSRYIHSMLLQEKRELTGLEHEVLKSLKAHEVLAQNVEDKFQQNLTIGERLADRISSFGGSWIFIGLFALVLITWVVLNMRFLLSQPFDPYPYILLNLILSCLAAIQAPVIMMSQNRQEIRDRLRAQSDYQVNLKAELEIRQLHEKIDHLISRQWKHLMEIQDIQTQIMSELAARGRGK